MKKSLLTATWGGLRTHYGPYGPPTYVDAYVKNKRARNLRNAHIVETSLQVVRGKFAQG